MSSTTKVCCNDDSSRDKSELCRDSGFGRLASASNTLNVNDELCAFEFVSTQQRSRAARRRSCFLSLPH